MADNANLASAKNAKNDEFYTQYSDIEAEMNAYVEFNPDVFRDKTILLPCDDPEWSNFTKYFAANFERFGLKKLISTSYAKGAGNMQLTLFEMESPLYDEELHESHGKLFTVSRDIDCSGSIDTDDIEFNGYLKGDGDFRSDEVTVLRDEADIIITNPPFSLFREFLAWILEGKKQFVIIGNQNVITYKEVFPLLKDNTIWLGAPFPSGNAYFDVPEDADTSLYAKGVYNPETKQLHFRNCRWFTNIDFGGRHEPLVLDTMAHNLKFNKKLKNKLEKDFGLIRYPHYDNMDAIEVPFTEGIPSDYDGIMGVPITFLDRYNPNQFEILGLSRDMDMPTKTGLKAEFVDAYFAQGNTGQIMEGHPDLGLYANDGRAILPYRRVMIRHRKGGNN
ncbi:MAG: adenine-specific methyltransferase EcoRI family protein [Bacteroidales bacterium]|nr:adenine-specific methyltransferase EcoRI family protein [Bacteroidales bacterium]